MIWKPKIIGEFSYLLWGIPLAVLVITFVVAWVSAAYSIHVEDHETFHDDLQERDSLKRQLDDREQRRMICQELIPLRDRGREILKHTIRESQSDMEYDLAKMETDFDAWIAQAEQVIEHVCQLEDLSDFQDPHDPQDVGPVRMINGREIEEHRGLKKKVRGRLDRIVEIIDRYRVSGYSET